MIDTITYEEMETVSKELSKYVDVIRNIIKNDELKDIEDFASTVDRYAKYLQTTVTLYKDADKAIADIK